MIPFAIGWILVTGSLFTFNCSSPLNRGKEECKKEMQEEKEYFERVWLHKDK